MLFLLLIFKRLLKHWEFKEKEKTDRLQILANSMTEIIQSNNLAQAIRFIFNASHKDDMNENYDFEIRKMKKEYTDCIYNELLNAIKETTPDKSNTTNNFKHPKRSDLAKKKKRSN